MIMTNSLKHEILEMKISFLRSLHFYLLISVLRINDLKTRIIYFCSIKKINRILNRLNVYLIQLRLV